MTKRYRTLAVFMILLLGLGLRSYRLGFQSLWNDEVITYEISINKPSIIVSNPPGDAKISPLFNLIIHSALRFGGHEALLRFVSMFFGSLSILMFYLVIRNLLSSNAGLIGAMIMAISPFHIWYSQEARSYILLLFLSLLSLLSLQELIKRRNNFWLKISFVISTALTFYCHTVGIAFVGFTLAYILLVIPHQKWKEWLYLFGAVLMLIAPAIYRFLIIQPAVTPNTFQSFSLLFAPYTIWAFGTGYSLGPTLNELHGLDPNRIRVVLSYFPIIFPVMLFLCVLLILGALKLWNKANLQFRITALWLTLPLAFALIGSTITVHAFNVRYAMLSFPAFIILLTSGIQYFYSKWITITTFAIILIISIFSLKNYYFDEQYHRNDYRAAGIFLSAHALPNDLVIASAAYTSNNLRYYYQGMPLKIIEYPQKKNEIENVVQFVEPSRVETEFKAILQDRERFWLFLSRTYHSDPHGYIRNYCDVHFIRERELKANGVNLVLYKKRMINNTNSTEQNVAGFRRGKYD